MTGKIDKISKKELLWELKNAALYISSYGGDVSGKFLHSGDLARVEALIAKAEQNIAFVPASDLLAEIKYATAYIKDFGQKDLFTAGGNLARVEEIIALAEACENQRGVDIKAGQSTGFFDKNGEEVFEGMEVKHIPDGHIGVVRLWGRRYVSVSQQGTVRKLCESSKFETVKKIIVSDKIELTFAKKAYASVPLGIFNCALGMAFSKGAGNITLGPDTALHSYLCHDDLTDDQIVLKYICEAALKEGAGDLILSIEKDNGGQT